ncbi:NUDIX hydrolase [Hylemonella sp. W303a]|uniref:NUDIX hydrolase n=1 Tax=Hylemonella sp. W303a TaxID=3389873 RepID=UPI00396B053D
MTELLRYQRAPLRVRDPLWLRIGAAAPLRIGSVVPEVAHALALASFEAGWCIHAFSRPDATLATLAQTLRERGLLGAWRDELLPVHPDSEGVQLGEPVARIERAAVRALGIATRAVHLHGVSVREGEPQGIWAQLRSKDKANDPGLWDTLMGGMVSAADTLEQALARETWEEAGLRLDVLHDVVYAGVLDIRKPSDGVTGVGYTVERIDWYRCTVPLGVEPVNQDGEVERFELVSPHRVRADVAAGRYTLEAALILAPDLIQPAG